MLDGRSGNGCELGRRQAFDDDIGGLGEAGEVQKDWRGPERLRYVLRFGMIANGRGGEPDARYAPGIDRARNGDADGAQSGNAKPQVSAIASHIYFPFELMHSRGSVRIARAPVRRNGMAAGDAGKQGIDVAGAARLHGAV